MIEGREGTDDEGSRVIVCIPVGTQGDVDPRWGRAARVAVVTIEGGAVADWQEHEVGWDVLHDAAGEGSHHARIARFLRDHAVDTVVANHMGGGMSRMLERMGIAVHLGAAGDARRAVEAAASA